jgi:hypothetical protein
MISIYKSNSNSALFGRFLEGDGFGLVTIPETESQAGLARVKATTLSEIGLRSRVRLGNRVKAFFLVRAGRLGRVCRVRVAGLSGLAGLSSDKAKTSPLANFSLIPKPGLGRLG